MSPQSIVSIPGFNEPFSSITHLVASLAFLALGILLLLHGSTSKGRFCSLRFCSLLVFVVSAVFLLAMSGVFHLLETGTTSRAVLQRLDHAGIFLLIAGSFTGIHGTIFKGWRRWGILSAVWFIALISITCKMVYFEVMPEWLGLALYLGMGWIGAISGVLLYLRFGLRFITPLIYGGIAYTIGAIIEFIQIPVLINGVIGAHELFHIAVLFGLGYHLAFIFRVSHPEVLHKWIDRRQALVVN